MTERCISRAGILNIFHESRVFIPIIERIAGGILSVGLCLEVFDQKSVLGQLPSNAVEDRRWRFYCCSVPNFKYTDCYVAHNANSMDKPMNYAVPRDYVIAGAHSTHRNAEEDRIWRYQICKFD
ncbi:hypothetical protein ScPMuIL_015598 [Solemya velum]